ncbi:MAG TPA: cell division protein FtsZ, partial [Candidatus Marinimicrobia bacterium]|nr:cell division protein FtsZ [Candidatus Neomarinimicrobiota bacterium]
LLEITDRRTTLSEAFKLADEVLRQAVQGVTDLILRPGFINVDFADVRTVMKDAGTAIMGIGCGDGEDRAIIAAQAAINSPLMDVPIGGASGILFNVTGNDSVGIHEIQEAARVITEAADPDATIIWGHVTDPDIDEDKIVITVIATGFPDNPGKMRSLKAGQRALGIDLVESEIKLASDQESMNVGELVFESELDIPPIIRKRRKS